MLELRCEKPVSATNAHSRWDLVVGCIHHLALLDSFAGLLLDRSQSVYEVDVAGVLQGMRALHASSKAQIADRGPVRVV